MKMGTAKYHLRLAKENFEGAVSEFSAKRYSNVGLLAIKALEQLIEACAAKEQLHFHETPKTAHANRRKWLELHYPNLIKYWEQLWSIYGILGYGGIDGERAEKAIKILKRVFKEIGEKEGFEDIRRIE